MDRITSFVVQGRDQALLYGDYSTYHTQLAKRLLSCRRKLGIATKNRGKFQKREPITPAHIAQNTEHVNLLLLTAERAWAQAMSMKASHTAAQKDLAGRARSHVISRLKKAAQVAQSLVGLLSASGSGASANDILEAKSYAASMRGAMFFERHNWNSCLQQYSVAYIIYGALASIGKGELFKDLLSDTIDPSIRYAAYQLRTPRTVPIQVIARQSFPRSDEKLVQEIDRLNPNLLAERDDSSDPIAAAETAPRTMTWRSREVPIEDAQISIAWASVEVAKNRLALSISQSQGKRPHQLAAQYDEVLMTTQDAVDAAKQAIDELKAEGVAQSDVRMQRLQITRTAVNYEMVGWRIGRNRVLTGPHDGGPEEYNIPRRRKAKPAEKQDAVAVNENVPELPASRRLAKLREKVALYDGTLQNLESIKELPGVAADEELATRIACYEKYFGALKCLSIARSHAINGNAANTLALTHHASCLLQDASANMSVAGNSPSEQAPLGVDVHRDAVAFLSNLVNGELQRYRAIVHIQNLRNVEQATTRDTSETPLIERLHTYPRRINLQNLVEFPPKMRPIPIKPIFLDVAWNYINYPRQTSSQTAESRVRATPSQHTSGEDPPKKKGWFGFGR